MLKRVKRKVSRNQGEEKIEDFFHRNGKESSPEAEILAQVVEDLKSEVKSLKEQLEVEKKNSYDVKSLKTQQICTLTFKLANAVRQREKAEEELVKLQKEMEELKDKVQNQTEQLLANINLKGELEHSAEQNENELKREGLTQDVIVDEDEKRVDDKGRVASPVPDLEYISVVAVVENKLLESQAEFTAEEKASLEGELENRAVQNKNDLESKGQADVSANEGGNSVDGNLESRTLVAAVENECLDTHAQTELYAASLLNDGLEKIGDEVLNEEQQQDIFQKENKQMSPTESTRDKGQEQKQEGASSFLEENDETQESNEIIAQEFTKIKTEMHEMKENMSVVQKMNQSLAEDLKNFANKQKRILKRKGQITSRKDKKYIESNKDEDDTFSPPASPEMVSLGRASFGSVPDEEHKGFSMDVEISEENYAAELEEDGGGEYEKSMATESHEKESDFEALISNKGFYEKETLPEISTIKKLNDFGRRTILQESNDGEPKDHRQEGIDRGTDKIYSDLTFLNVTREVEELKQQLAKAMQEIEGLQHENKEMKTAILSKLSSSAVNGANKQKATYFTDQQMREMTDWDQELTASRRYSSVENSAKYSLDSRDYWTEGRSIESSGSIRRLGAAGITSLRKTLLPLKLIGARLKELTISVENMAMNATDHEDDLLMECTEDTMDDKSLHTQNHGEFSSQPMITRADLFENSLPPSFAYKRENASVNNFPGSKQLLGAYTAAEKLGEEGYILSSRPRQLIKKEEFTSKTDGTFRPVDPVCGVSSLNGDYRPFKKCCVATRDNIRRYIVCSSERIAKLRDLKPEELSFYTKTS